MPDLTEEQNVQLMAVQVVMTGGDVLLTAAKYCNTSPAVISMWAQRGFSGRHPDVRDSMVSIAKAGLKKALDEYDIL